MRLKKLIYIFLLVVVLSTLITVLVNYLMFYKSYDESQTGASDYMQLALTLAAMSTFVFSLSSITILLNFYKKILQNSVLRFSSFYLLPTIFVMLDVYSNHLSFERQLIFLLLFTLPFYIILTLAYVFLLNRMKNITK